MDVSHVQIEIWNAYKIYVGNTNDQRHQEDLENKRKILYARLEALLDVSSKGKAHPRKGYKDPEGEKRYNYNLSLISALDGGGWSTPLPGCFIPWKDPEPIIWEAGWETGPVWTGAENLATTEIRSPDRPARSELL